MTNTFCRISQNLIRPALLGGLLSALIVSPAAIAQDEPVRWYQVELLFFLNNNQAGLDSESWPELAPRISHDESIALNGKAPQRIDDAAPGQALETPFHRLPVGELQLQEQWDRLKRASAYNPFLLLGWRQPIPESKRGTAVYLQGETPIRDLVAQQLETLPPVFSGRPLEESDTGDQRLEDIMAVMPDIALFDANITVTRGRYLHLNLEAAMRTPQWALRSDETQIEPLALPADTQTTADTQAVKEETAEPTYSEDLQAVIEQGQLQLPISEDPLEWSQLMSSIDGKISGYAMKERRRMRSQELHYLDHPRFGVLAYISRYTPERAQAAPEPHAPPAAAPAESTAPAAPAAAAPASSPAQ